VFHLLQGWYGCGFGYGMWVGILMALGFKVVPVRAQAWKSAMGISGRQYTKVCVLCQNSCTDNPLNYSLCKCTFPLYRRVCCVVYTFDWTIKTIVSACRSPFVSSRLSLERVSVYESHLKLMKLL